MIHCKNFPRTIKDGTYPIWEEIRLSNKEEIIQERMAREENISLMKDCLKDAMEIIKDKSMKAYQSDILSIAIALFRKRASHTVYWKDSRCKEKFDKMFPKA